MALLTAWNFASRPAFHTVARTCQDGVRVAWRQPQLATILPKPGIDSVARRGSEVAESLREVCHPVDSIRVADESASRAAFE